MQAALGFRGNRLCPADGEVESGARCLQLYQGVSGRFNQRLGAAPTRILPASSGCHNRSTHTAAAAAAAAASRAVAAAAGGEGSASWANCCSRLQDNLPPLTMQGLPRMVLLLCIVITLLSRLLLLQLVAIADAVLASKGCICLGFQADGGRTAEQK